MACCLQDTQHWKSEMRMDVEVVVLTGQTCLALELPTLIIIHYGFAEQVL